MQSARLVGQWDFSSHRINLEQGAGGALDRRMVFSEVPWQSVDWEGKELAKATHREVRKEKPPLWVWVKIKPPGDRRFESLFPFTRVTCWVPIFDPHPFWVLLVLRHHHACLFLRVPFFRWWFSGNRNLKKKNKNQTFGGLNCVCLVVWFVVLFLGDPNVKTNKQTKTEEGPLVPSEQLLNPILPPFQAILMKYRPGPSGKGVNRGKR